MSRRPHLVASLVLAGSSFALACAEPPPAAPPAEPPASGQAVAALQEAEVTGEQAFEVGRAYWAHKDFSAARVAFARAAKERPLAHLWAAEAAMRDGADELALSHASQIPDAPARLFTEGLALSRLGDQSGAREKYEAALEYDPHDPALWNNLGTTYYLERDFQAAWDATESVLKLPRVSDLSRSIALANLAELRMLAGDYDGAHAYLDASAELTPEEAHPYFGEAVLADLEGDTAGALFLMETGLQLDADGEVRFATVFAYTEQAAHFDGLQREAAGQFDRARAAFSALVSLQGAREEFVDAAARRLGALPERSETEPAFVLPAALAPVAAPSFR